MRRIDQRPALPAPLWNTLWSFPCPSDQLDKAGVVGRKRAPANRENEAHLFNGSSGSEVKGETSDAGGSVKRSRLSAADDRIGGLVTERPSALESNGKRNCLRRDLPNWSDPSFLISMIHRRRMRRELYISQSGNRLRSRTNRSSPSSISCDFMVHLSLRDLVIEENWLRQLLSNAPVSPMPASTASDLFDCPVFDFQLENQHLSPVFEADAQTLKENDALQGEKAFSTGQFGMLAVDSFQNSTQIVLPERRNDSFIVNWISMGREERWCAVSVDDQSRNVEFDTGHYDHPTKRISHSHGNFNSSIAPNDIANSNGSVDFYEPPPHRIITSLDGLSSYYSLASSPLSARAILSEQNVSGNVDQLSSFAKETRSYYLDQPTSQQIRSSFSSDESGALICFDHIILGSSFADIPCMMMSEFYMDNVSESMSINDNSSEQTTSDIPFGMSGLAEDSTPTVSSDDIAPEHKKAVNEKGKDVEVINKRSGEKGSLEEYSPVGDSESLLWAPMTYVDCNG